MLLSSLAKLLANVILLALFNPQAFAGLLITAILSALLGGTQQQPEIASKDYARHLRFASVLAGIDNVSINNGIIWTINVTRMCLGNITDLVFI